MDNKIAWWIAFVYLIAIILILFIDWLIVCGITYLICLCFNWSFTLLIGTGVWLIKNVVFGAINSLRLGERK